MSATIDVLGAGDLARLPPGDGTLAYLTALVRDGARSYVDNADVETRLLVVDGTALPLVVAHGVEGNTDLCSPFAHYVLYSIDELAKRHRRVPSWLFRAVIPPARAVLRGAEIDRVVFVNNWLWTTNPSPALTATQIGALTSALATTYPDAAIVFRSVNPQLDPSYVDALRQSSYRLVRSRRVYLLDARRGLHLAHSNTRDDANLLRRTSYAIVTEPDALAPHVARIAALYRDLYLTKHSLLNPRFTERFFALTLRERAFSYRALVRDGQLDAFIACHTRGGVMTAHLLGYDQRLPRKLGLYRLGLAMAIAEAGERGLMLNLSGGSGTFKMLRGAVPVEEFDAVYDRHLPLHRRLAWSGLLVAGRLAAARGPRPAAPPIVADLPGVCSIR